LRFVVTGRGGQLGTCLVDRLEASAGDELAAAFGHDELELEKPEQLAAIFEGLPGGAPDVLLNAAAYTKVDLCEDERELAQRVNGEAPALLARLCADAGVRLVHVSTDYVFDGTESAPYALTAPTNPQSVYGASKLEGEQRVLAASPDFAVVRTSWVFGPGHNFVATMLRLAREQRSGRAQQKMRVVDDQLGCPTYAGDLADALLQIGRSGEGGLFHFSNAQPTSWWGFAREILDQAGFADIEIERGKTEDLNQRAPRPRYSVLDCSRAKTLGVPMRPWSEALAAYLRSEPGRKAQLPN
jgi:dTDP-4-dehydrorhamnose reductase